ncbi:MAG: hypothetical protein ACI31G_02455 [Bacilli bacterium]
MPEKVKESKSKINKGIAIYSVVLTIIPVIVILCTGFKNFKYPYGIYSLFTFGISVYFSCFIALLTRKNKVLYAIFDILNAIIAVGFVIVSYIFSSYQGGLLLHLAASFMLIYSLYRECDAKQSDNYNLCYLPQVGFIISGLIFVLWFISAKFYVAVHVVIVTIVNLFSVVLYLIPSFVTSLKKGKDFYYDVVETNEVEYVSETEEERLEHQREKKQKREDAKIKKDLLKASSQPNKNQVIKKGNKNISKLDEKNLYEEFKHLPNGYTLEWIVDPDVIDRMLETIRKQFNFNVEWINDGFRSNNRELEYRYRTAESVKIASDNNKKLEKDYKMHKSNYKKLKSRLNKLGKMVFTSKDCYKHFTYELKSGRLKSKPQEGAQPTLFIRGVSYSVIYAATNFSWGQDQGAIKIDSREVQLLFKSQVYRNK